ncbi:MAG: hypothetical protein FWE29_02065 [Defluviitaleaceae bacterium]|nr:hypothetical protein [Defluviitaleaceae bacterium]
MGKTLIAKPSISQDFTIEDIHKIREYHYELTKDMPFEERAEFYRKGAEEFTDFLAKRRELVVSRP